MNVTPELHHPIKVDELPAKGRTVELRAADDERAAIAARLGLVGLSRLEAELKLQPEIGRQISLRGSIRAEIVQNCVVTGDSLETRLEFEMDRIYAEDADPFDGLNNSDDDAVVDPDVEDPDPIIGGKIDVGEQVIEELALNIPLYPRAPDAVFEEITTDQAQEDTRPNPFSVLSALKDQIKTKD
jgi:uncharacterized metal-binding protein YceD (DUF177 family)